MPKEKKFKNGLDMMEGAISFYLYMAGTFGDQFLLLHRHDAYEFAKINPICREHLEDIYNCLLEIFLTDILYLIHLNLFVFI